jgi:hypothetical protein
VVLTLLLYLVPYGDTIAYPLLLISTLAHELGHGVAGVLVGGEFHSLKIFPDASGMASISFGGGRIASAVVAAGGLVGPPVVAALLFMVSVRPKVARFALAGIAMLLVAILLLLVRNPFGWVFVGLVAALAGLIAWKASARVAQLVVVFIAVQLALSVYSRGDYLFTDVARTAQGPAPSDVAQMADALFLPYWFWGGVCALLSVLVLAGGTWLFWRATRAS